jgi:anti-sigma regulatory factor (Ser/Thr protein kinase)
MMPSERVNSGYTHGLLVHHTDEELVEATREFVAHGLASGGQVLVHGTRDRVSMLHGLLDPHPRLEFGLDEDLYVSPARTLFTYQRKLAETAPGVEHWVTGTVPLGEGSAGQAAWARYESAVNEALSSFPFRALCTYDARTRPASVIAAARATHPNVGADVSSPTSPEYVDPAAFLADPLAQVPSPPQEPPSLTIALGHLDHLARARYLVRSTAAQLSAVSHPSIEELVIAVNEVAANGLVHGAPPVSITLWTELDSLTCQVVDSGAGCLDPLSGYRYPDESSPLGLWSTRQLVDDMFIGRGPHGGCSVLLTKT